MSRLPPVRPNPLALSALAVLLACTVTPVSGSAADTGAPPTPSAWDPTAPAPTLAPTVTVERVDSAPECEGLVPEGPAPAAVEATRTVRSGDACAGATSDGSGHVALGVRDAAGTSSWEVRTADGVALATVSAPGLDGLLPAPSGWHGVAVVSGGTAPGGHVDHLTVSPEGAVAATTTLSPDPAAWTSFRAAPARDPDGGCLVVVSSTSLSGNHWYALSASHVGPVGAVPPPAPVADGSDPHGPAFLAGGVTTSGAALVAWQGPGQLLLRWFGPDGAASGPPSGDVDLATLGASYASRLELAPLLDGSLALRVDGGWKRAYAPGGAAGPAPDWLAALPGTELRFTRGNRGYAVLPASTASCTRVVELRAPSGRRCGTVTIHGAGDACLGGSVDQGWDGTLLEQRSQSTCDSAGCTCAYRWWPGVLARAP